MKENIADYDAMIAEFVRGAIGTVEKVGQFAANELPGFIVEVLNWYFAYNLILFAIGIAVIPLAILIDYKLLQLFKRYAEEQDDEFVIWFVWGIFGTVLRALLILVLVNHFLNLQWLKILIAPKLWLIEYAANLLK